MAGDGKEGRFRVTDGVCVLYTVGTLYLDALAICMLQHFKNKCKIGRAHV